jgi:stage V sporulation protein B
MKHNLSKRGRSAEQSFLHGSLILVIATALVKIIGAIYRIPLANLLGTTGMGFYSTAYDLYVPMYSIAMAGLPIAISRIVAEHVAAGKYKDVRKTLNIAKLAFIVTGTTGFILMIIAAFLLTKGTNVFNIGSLPGILAIAPCILFCCIMSAYRGYYEGLKNMTPTAVSQVIEALGKLLFGFGFAFAILKLTNNYSLAAAGALLGISFGTAFSALYLWIKFKLNEKYEFEPEQLMTSPIAQSGKNTLKNLCFIAIPIVLGSLVNNITSLIDVAMVQSQLGRAIEKAPEYFSTNFANLIAYETSNDVNFKWATDLPNSLYGCHRGFAFSIYNLVPVLTSVLGVSAIPILASAWTKGDKAEVKSNVQTMLRTTALIAIPAGIGITVLSKNILSLLYSNETAIDVAAPNLRVLGICAIFAGLNAPIVSMLQAIGKQGIPLKNIAIGAILKIVINFVLVGTPEINILGVPIGTTVCYAYICIANFICFVKYSGVIPNIYKTLGKPLIAGLLCGASALTSELLLSKISIRESIITLISIFFAVIIYIFMLIILRAVEREDIISLPKGKKIEKILAKLKIIR